MKFILTSEYSLRLEPDAGPMTVEALEPDEQYSPFHMLASSLAYCTFSVMYSWATHTRQPADDLVIEVAWQFSTDEPRRISEIRMDYSWASLPEKKRSAARRVAEMCTIHATLMHPPLIAIGELSSAATSAPGQPDVAVSDAHVPASNPAPS